MGGPISGEDRGGTGGIDEISLTPSAHIEFPRSVSLIMQTAVNLFSYFKFESDNISPIINASIFKTEFLVNGE